jgi:hypothetical protein
MPRHLLIHKIKSLFHHVAKRSWYRKLWRFPFIVRIVIAFFLISYGLVAIISPLPIGSVGIVLGASLLIGVEPVRRATIRVIHFLRIHILFSKLYIWWKKR